MGLFNTIETGQACSGQISLKELALEEEEYLVYSDKTQFNPRILRTADAIPFFLENMESDLISLAPIQKGFSVLGVVDFFAAPALVEAVEYSSRSYLIHLYQKGRILAFCQHQPVSVMCEGEPLQKVDGDLSCGRYSWQNGIMEICAEGINVEIRI